MAQQDMEHRNCMLSRQQQATGQDLTAMLQSSTSPGMGKPARLQADKKIARSPCPVGR